MEFWKRSEGMTKAVNDEKNRLLAFDDVEAQSLSLPDQYTRMRFLREIEAMEMVNELRRKHSMQPPAVKPIREKYAKAANPYWVD